MKKHLWDTSVRCAAASYFMALTTSEKLELNIIKSLRLGVNSGRLRVSRWLNLSLISSSLELIRRISCSKHVANHEGQVYILHGEERYRRQLISLIDRDASWWKELPARQRPWQGTADWGLRLKSDRGADQARELWLVGGLWWMMIWWGVHHFPALIISHSYPKSARSSYSFFILYCTLDHHQVDPPPIINSRSSIAVVRTSTILRKVLKFVCSILLCHPGDWHLSRAQFFAHKFLPNETCHPSVYVSFSIVHVAIIISDSFINCFIWFHSSFHVLGESHTRSLNFPQAFLQQTHQISFHGWRDYIRVTSSTCVNDNHRYGGLSCCFRWQGRWRDSWWKYVTCCRR